jgi:uncharacterized membrane protein YphA (DoxX/SURF4 family)
MATTQRRGSDDFFPSPSRQALDERRYRIITVALGVIFFASGLSKVLFLPLAVDFFHAIHFARWALPVVGAAEVVLAVLMVASPATKPWGATGIGALMTGAAMTHVMTGVMLPMLFLDLTLFNAAVWVVVKHRPDFMRLKA